VADKAKVKQVANIVATGVIGSDPKSAGSYTKVRFAVSQPGVKQSDGSYEDRPSIWFDVMAKGEQLEGVSKGDKAVVSGRLSAQQSEQYGTQLTIWVDSVKPAVPEAIASAPKAKSKPDTELAFPE
jgi:single-stranded DNA-binding protein